VAPEDAVTLLFHETWPYHAGLVDRADRYRPSIGEFVAFARTVHDPGAYAPAQARRAEVRAAWLAWFAEHRVDVLLEPTIPWTARPRGDGYDPGHLGGQGDPLIVLTSTWNFTGFPVATLPAGLGAATGLPVGVSLIAPTDGEAVAAQVAIDLQEHALPPPRL
jgi:aspartyl-tRNA(Asn)/glutamyl-tRNA(Gln) amidotransferase subunit A